jgi:hypothetical protein
MLLCSPGSPPGPTIRAALAILLNLSLAAFLADAVLSVVDELGFLLAGAYLLAWIRGPVAGMVVLGSLPLCALIVLCQRVPRAIFLPVALYPLAALFHGPLLVYWVVGRADAMGLISAGQLAVALWSLVVMRRRLGRPWFVEEDFGEPLFALGPTLRMLALTLIILPAVAGLSLLALGERGLDRFTGGYVVVHRGGLDLVERGFHKPDSVVRLVGMMHIGQEHSYQELVASFDRPEVLVLAEGVTDEGNILGLGRGEGYRGLAEQVGLSNQRDLTSYRPSIRQRHADLDVAELSPSTQRLLRRTLHAFGAEGVDTEALLTLLTSSEDLTPEVQERFWYDVIDRRNEVLLGHLRAAVEEEPEVVIPWGAAHLPAVEREVRAMGYELVEERRHPLLRW